MQNLPFGMLRHPCPGLPVENVGVRFHLQTGAPQFLFVPFQNLTQRANFAFWPAEEFPNRIDLHVSALVLLQGETDGDALRESHQHGCVRRGRCRRGCKT